MRKFYLLLIAFLALTNSYSQEVYFLTGSNFTKYDFKSQNSPMTTVLQSGTGSNYELGHHFSLKIDEFSLSVGVTLNEFNALAGSSANTYQWNTKYIGVQSALHYTYSVTKEFQVALKAGVNLSKIVYGKQNTNGVVYDLMDQKEFSGALFSDFVGMHLNYKFSDLGCVSLGYGLLNSRNTSNRTQEKVAFTSTQLQFGIHFNINK